eukprot:2573154-Rhodomonas_salina.1
MLGAATGKAGKKAKTQDKEKEGVKVVVTDKEGRQQKLPLPLCPGCIRSPMSAAPAPVVGELVQVLVAAGEEGGQKWAEGVVRKVDVSA